MKLIDILVRDLHKFGGWPEGAVECHRFVDEANIDFYDADGQWDDDCFLKYGAFAREVVREQVLACESESITRSQYEAALASSKPEWDGVGLPPVGVNAEVFFSADTEPKWHSFLAKFIGENHVIALVGMEEISYKKDELLTSEVKFAPLRSEEVRKHDEITQSILDVLNDYDFELVHIRSDQKRIATDLVERINSGMIPHIRID
ncbi:hypothetical protein [Citrobacter amalonaticus]|uniref:Uncharacterized protein n=1 Tax=Citrobacter amalonaticus TaxID=35703 RepID=A0A6N2RCA2_CITAM